MCGNGVVLGDETAPLHHRLSSGRSQPGPRGLFVYLPLPRTRAVPTHSRQHREGGWTPWSPPVGTVAIRAPLWAVTKALVPLPPA